jgi:hypothetical protein
MLIVIRSYITLSNQLFYTTVSRGNLSCGGDDYFNKSYFPPIKHAIYCLSWENDIKGMRDAGKQV